jgi:hypothetical protein
MSGPVLPDAMRTRPFTVAELRDAGLPRSRLRHPGLHLPTRSVRSVAPVDTVLDRAIAFAAALPGDCAFSHATAALILGLPLPQRFEAQTALDVMRPSHHTPIRRRGCVGHRGLETRMVVEASGLRVVAPVDTWVDLGELTLRGLTVDDLVVAGDVVVGRLRPGDPPLSDAVASRSRPRGASGLVRAAALVRPGSRSPMETRSRLMFHRAGFPEPEVNSVVRDAQGGWLLEGDLVWRQHRVIGEYQGAHHASIKRRSADSSRASSVEEHGWRVLEIFADDVLAGARRRACLTRFARAMRLDVADLRID